MRSQWVKQGLILYLLNYVDDWWITGNGQFQMYHVAVESRVRDTKPISPTRYFPKFIRFAELLGFSRSDFDAAMLVWQISNISVHLTEFIDVTGVKY